MKRLGGWVIASFAITGLALAAAPGEAQRGLRAQVYLTQQQPPRGQSERQLLAWARRANSMRLHETREGELDDREWRANLVIAFNRPPGDIEFHVLFYDTQDGPRRFLQDMSTYVNDANQETYVQRIKLERPEFQPNRRTELVVTVRRQEVARKSFHLLGEERQNSGEVSFSEEETPEGRAAAQRQQQIETQREVEAADPEPDYQEPTTESSNVAPTDMELMPSADMPQETEPSEAGRSGGLCSVARGPEAALPPLVVAGIAVFVFARRWRRKSR